ncbi:MAG: RimK family alpha-L-glutamate ligase [Eubacteriales bacterium]
MLGWLVINSFIDSKKFNELYDCFKNASMRNGIDLEIKTTDSLICDIESNFTNFKLPDFVLFWDKDIYLAQMLEQQNLRLFNSARAIELCDNKILTGLCLKNKVPIPKTIIAPKTFEGVNYCKKEFLVKSIEILGLPLIIKEANGSFGQQVYLAKSYEEAEKIIDNLGHKEFLMQEYINTSQGKDIRVNVVGSQVVSAMLRYNDNDFRSNISNGGKMKPVSITQHQEQVAITACQTIGLDYAGVDILFGINDEPIVCEVNSNPHFKSSYECTGIDMSMKIMEHVKRCV